MSPSNEKARPSSSQVAAQFLPKSSPNRPRRDPKSSQKGSWEALGTLPGAPEAPKSTTERPSTLTRVARERPRAPKGRPKVPQGRPKGAQELPKSALGRSQERPKSPQEASRSGLQQQPRFMSVFFTNFQHSFIFLCFSAYLQKPDPHGG